MLVQKELPLFKSLKTLRGFKIRAITIVPGGDVNDLNWYLYPEDYTYGPVVVSNVWSRKHQPRVGGYYVVYKGGYTSYHPAKTFEEGYQLVNEPPPWPPLVPPAVFVPQHTSV